MKKKNVLTVYDSSRFQNKTELTFDEMVEDLECFEYLLRTSYAGYDDACSRGMNTAEINNSVINQFYGSDNISINDFVDYLYKSYEPYIKDYHASLFNKQNEYKFIKPAKNRFSDVYIKNDDSEYTVVESNVEEIVIGMNFTDDEKFLFNYPSKGDSIYRLGIINKENTNLIKIKFDDKEVEIPVKFFNSLDEDFNVEKKETRKSLYIKYNSCCAGNEEELRMQNAFAGYGKQARDKEFVIIDVRGNRGGTDEYMYQFLFSLVYGEKKFNYISPEYKQIYSPVILESIYENWNDYNYGEKFPYKFKSMMRKFKRNPVKIIETCGLRQEISKNTNGNYTGKIIIITDSYTASSGEEIISVGKNLIGDNLIQVGLNTAGCQLYGNIQYYYLCNSGIGVSLASSDFSYQANNIKSFHGEGYGYYPDYWSTNEDLNETIFYITQDKELRNELNDYF